MLLLWLLLWSISSVGSAHLDWQFSDRLETVRNNRVNFNLKPEGNVESVFYRFMRNNLNFSMGEKR